MACRIIVITSGKGGVGKTTTTANLAVALANEGYRVVAIDGDVGLRNLDVIMGLENRIVYTLVDVIEGTCRLNQAMIRDKRTENLYMIPTAQSRTKDAVSAEQMLDICGQLRKEFDFVLIDSPAGIEAGFRNAAAGADEALVVTTPEVSAVRDADRIIGLLESMEKAPISLIINRIKPDMVKRGDMLSTEDVLDILAVDLIGVVPDDESVVTSSNKGEPLTFSNSSRATKAFLNIAKRICGNEVPFMDLSDDQKGFFSSLKRIFGN
ncbi:MAG TPA: septum site-determining protein MinD [Synergistaceae bacterium]|jgi:septum site-determining protein MinD|nr:septum site-determining protein MinD [Synergistaceae bacterium]NLL41141.1 septum site-determining protein MinD [Synergistaceae bacterium]HPX03815.1 septum site-determining protein MinD [Synergistaceae bacterium]HQA53927.1 septum site-determining protein MinD [Synergistaceae bacterium]